METIVLLPEATWSDRDRIASELVAASIAVSAPKLPEGDRPGLWVASVARDLLVDPPVPPLLVVARGAAGVHVPAVAFAQRAAHRAVTGYVLIDAEFPAPQAVGGTDWPDAPVTYVLIESGEAANDRALQARLRGWEVVEAGAGVPEQSPEQSLALRALLDALG